MFSDADGGMGIARGRHAIVSRLVKILTSEVECRQFSHIIDGFLRGFHLVRSGDIKVMWRNRIRVDSL
jgi:hypothetical protein